jgi:predicted nucleic acid-binding protein
MTSRWGSRNLCKLEYSIALLCILLKFCAFSTYRKLGGASLLTRRRGVAEPSLGFSDCLTLQLAKKSGHLPLGTFDRDLAKIEGVQKVV